jgi:hypothetical protein
MLTILRDCSDKKAPQKKGLEKIYKGKKKYVNVLTGFWRGA